MVDAPSPPDQTRTLRGILIMVVSIFFFASMDALVKLVSEEVSTVTTLWWRYAGQLVWTVVILLALNRGAALKSLSTTVPRLHALRSVLLFGATASFYTALTGLPIAAATAVFEIAPLVILILSVIFLKEQVGPWRWAAVGVGFAGALIIIRPGSELFSPFSLLVICAATCYAAYAVATRFLPSGENPWSSLFFAGVFGAVASSVLMLFYGEVPPTRQALMLLLIIGPIGGLGQLLLILALQHAPASVLAPFGYVGLAYATVWGLVLFGEVPDAPTILGASIIVGSGLFVWYRERLAARNG